MARQNLQVTVKDPTGREYVGGGSYSTVSQHDSEDKGIKRAVKQIAGEFGPGDFQVVRVEPSTYAITKPRMKPTAAENEARRRNTLLWMLVRTTRQDDPLKLVADYAAKGQPNTGYANVANALAWRVEDAMRADVKRAYAVSILDDMDERKAFTANWRVFAEDEVLRGEHSLITDPGAFDEVIDYFKRVALQKALAGVANQSTSPAHNMLGRIEHDVAADLYETLSGKGGWW